MKTRTILLLPLLAIIFGCIEKTTTPIRTNSQKASQPENVKSESKVEDSTPVTNQIQKYFHPNMSHCGGALYGFYKKNELVRIESTYGGELGYSEKNVVFKEGEVTKISYRKHFANWKEYERVHQGEEYDASKMTFSDTLRVIEFGEKMKTQTFVEKRLISEKIDPTTISELLKCVETMKNELDSERVLVKE